MIYDSINKEILEGEIKMANFKKFETPLDIQKKALECVEISKNTGKIKKGTNETTKTIERGLAKLVLIAENIDPEEIIAHIGPLCEEKEIPYLYVNDQKDLGKSCGLSVGCASVAIIDCGKSLEDINDIINKINTLKK